MFKLETSASFDSAHFLMGYKGKCANIHGHHWVAQVSIFGDELTAQGEKRGMLIDFSDLKKAVRELCDSLDHTLIYEKGSLKDSTVAALREEGFSLTQVDFRPTAENFARFFHESLCSRGLPVKTVKIYETPDNCAVFEV